MKRMIYLIVLVTIPFFLQSQSLFKTKSRITIQAAIDPASMLSIRYEHHPKKKLFEKDIYPYLEFSSSPAIWDLENFELKMGQRMSLLNFGKVQLVSGLNTSFGNLKTANFNSKKLSMEGDFAFGYYSRKCFFALTTSYERILITQLRHSDYYKERFFPDAVDGWYTGSGGAIHIGLEGGITFKQIFDIFIELKIPRTSGLRSLMGSPGHLGCGLSYRF